MKIYIRVQSLRRQVYHLLLFAGPLLTGYGLFLIILYLPANNRVGWVFPLGWDAPAYLAWVRYIGEHGYLYTILRQRYPFGTHFVVYLFSYVTGGDLLSAWHYSILSFLLLSVLGIGILYRRCFNSHLWAGVAGGLFPFLVTTQYMFGGLLQQTAFISILPFFYFAVLRYVEIPSQSNFATILSLWIVSWLLWPWGSPFLIPALLLAALLAGTRGHVRRNLMVSAVFMVAFLASWYFAIYYPVLERYLISAGQTPRPLIGLSRNIRFTFDEFTGLTSNGSPWLLALLALSIGLFFLRNKTAKHSRILLGLITVGFLGIILLVPWDEMSRRLTPFLLQSIWFVYPFDVLSRKAMRTPFTARGFGMSILLVVLFLAVVGQLNPYSQPVVQTREVRWRIWFSGDTSSFFNSLQKAKAANVDNDLIILPLVNGTRIPYVIPFCFYVKSYFPESIVGYVNFGGQKLSNLSSSQFIITYPHHFCSFTLDGKSIKDYLASNQKITFLFLRGFSPQGLDIQADSEMNESGYYLMTVNLP